MKKLICDICGKEANHSLEMPRIIRSKARGGNGYPVLAVYDEVGTAITDLCCDCYNKIATLLPVIDMEDLRDE